MNQFSLLSISSFTCFLIFVDGQNIISKNENLFYLLQNVNNSSSSDYSSFDHRLLKSKTANSFLQNYIKSVDVDTFSPETNDGVPVQSNSPEKTNDYNYACNGNVFQNLYHVPELEGECTCEDSATAIICNVTAAVCDETDGYCQQKYDYWFFHSITGYYTVLSSCAICISGNCDLFDDWCLNLFYEPNDLISPYACDISFESTNFEPACNAYTQCNICTTVDGDYGAQSSDCSLTTTGECWSGKFFTNPFPELRKLNIESKNKSNFTKIIGGIIGIILFVGIGGSIYYILHKKFPDEDDEENDKNVKTNKNLDEPTETNEKL